MSDDYTVEAAYAALESGEFVVQQSTVTGTTFGFDSRATAGDVRTWAQENGLNVGKRGRVSAELKAQFTEATGRDVR